MSEISIQEVLFQIEDLAAAGGSTFSIDFVISSGPNRGQIRRLDKCRKGRSTSARTTGKNASNTPKTESRKKALHKYQDTIPITDLVADQYKTILVSHLIRFNDQLIRH